MIKRLSIILISTLSSVLLLSPQLATAAEFDPFGENCEGVDRSEVCKEVSKGDENPISGTGGVILGVVRILSFVIGVAAVLMLILGGLKYVTSAGDSNAIASAKNTILYALVGVVVAAASQAIIIYVTNRL